MGIARVGVGRAASVRAVALETLPHRASILRYRLPGNYVDCFGATLRGTIGVEQLLASFLTAPAFRPERWLLACALDMRSGDGEAQALARGDRQAFAAWSVEERDAEQVLLCDFLGHTRSWFMTEPGSEPGGGIVTRVRYGTAIVRRDMHGVAHWGWSLAFWPLLPLHRLYARILLASTLGRITRGKAP